MGSCFTDTTSRTRSISHSGSNSKKDGATITRSVGPDRNECQEIATVEMPGAAETQVVGVFAALNSDYNTGNVEFRTFSTSDR